MIEYPHRYVAHWDEETETLNLRFATQTDIDHLVYPKSVKTLLIEGVIDHINVPEGIENVYISKTGLRNITLPDSVQILRCEDNSLRFLELPGGIVHVDTSRNPLGVLTFRAQPSNLATLDVSNTLITKLDFVAPESLYDLNVSWTCLEEVSPNLIRGMVRDTDEPGIVYFRP
jgi:hypothetical protein